MSRSPDATRWCLMGAAISLVAPDDDKAQAVMLEHVLNVLRSEIVVFTKDPHIGVAEWQDHTDHKTLLYLLDRLIRRYETEDKPEQDPIRE